QTWDLQCDLASSTFVGFANKFDYEFRFARRQTTVDRAIVSCPIARSDASSYLAGYVLTLDVREKVEGLNAWKAVLSCSVTVTEVTAVPTVFSEKIVMNETYGGDDNGVAPGYALLFLLVSLAGLSFLARFLRQDSCVVCGYRLVWFREICLPCRFYGHVPPSEA
ncbi:unnamed protein product, partial [Phaeothamnion confervicola]